VWKLKEEVASGMRVGTKNKVYCFSGGGETESALTLFLGLFASSGLGDGV